VLRVHQLTHLQRLEAESIHIMREVVAEAENPVMLYSIGKDSAVMLHLAMKAFYPAVPPFPLLHVDTTLEVPRRCTIPRCDGARSWAWICWCTSIPRAWRSNINPFTHGSAIHTDIMKTEGLKQALDKYGFDVAFGGARRDEEKSRAKERIFSFRSAQHRWDPKSQRPELWKLYNARKHKGESIRVFPISNWTELDIWQYIYLENIPIVPLYYAGGAPGGGARRHADHGRRRAHAAQPGRGADDEEGALPHPGLLPADRRGRVRSRHADRHHPGDAADQDLRAPGPRDRPRLDRLDGKEEAGGYF
jgi:sulfate adenylyltransferase subunit 2